VSTADGPAVLAVGLVKLVAQQMILGLQVKRQVSAM